MFVSYRWLQEYVNIDVTPADLAEKITRAGIEVEAVEDMSRNITGVVVGYVVEREKHPQADKLSVCKVDVGAEELLQIVCGAKNVAQGQKVPVATVGAVLPGNFKIKKAKLRGELSQGMICSLSELGVESKLVAKEYAEGIYVFPSDTPVGMNALEALHMNDHVLELSLTPNRADAMNMLGVAYEVAAILGGEVKKPEISYKEGNGTTSDYISIRVEAPKENPLYIAKVVKNVEIKESPLWLQARLMAAGVRPINNIVDVTNYVLMEYGQPLHAFDYDKLNSKEIVVRLAHEDEKIKTLDDQERTLKPHHLVITNGKEAVAVAGVMGGANSEVDNDTKNVLIESAVFAPLTVRIGSKDLGLRSESSARFEKGIDHNRTKEAVERAAALMASLGGENVEVMDGVVEVNNLETEATVVTATADRINDILGTNVSVTEMADIFARLGFEATEDNGTFHVTIPTRRGDITIVEDLAEEVGRMYGYDNIPVTLPVVEATPGRLTDYQIKRRQVRRFLEGAGMHEAVTYSLTSASKATRYSLEGANGHPVSLAMPMSEERSQLRLSLIPHLLDALSYNVARKNDDVSLYEIGSVFLPNGENELPTEIQHVAGAVTGLVLNNTWQGEKKAVDFYVVKGIVDGLMAKFGLTVSYKAAQKDGMHPGRTAAIMHNDKEIGFIGAIHPEVQKEMDLKETYVFEIALPAIIDASVEEVRYTQIPRFPSMTRDMALVVDRDIPAGDIATAILTAGGKLLKDVRVFDLYQGDKMEEGKKSLAFSLRYFDAERTLTDEEVTNAHNKVLKAVEEQFNAVLRG
ncbi:MAG: phenylalanine--tRNA ligase subunit beta [Bacillaceae bacterium]